MQYDSSMTQPPLARRLLAELLGSAFLAALVIGSGIAAQTLSPTDVGRQLFENAAATAIGLATIILMFGPISGGHFNPVVPSLRRGRRRERRRAS
jgi:arsenate reductase